eukprot:scaffold34453_cov52-Phaeocystis_antarctica.AAC.2
MRSRRQGIALHRRRRRRRQAATGGLQAGGGRGPRRRQHAVVEQHATALEAPSPSSLLGRCRRCGERLRAGAGAGRSAEGAAEELRVLQPPGQGRGGGCSPQRVEQLRQRPSARQVAGVDGLRGAGLLQGSRPLVGRDRLTAPPDHEGEPLHRRQRRELSEPLHRRQRCELQDAELRVTRAEYLSEDEAVTQLVGAAQHQAAGQRQRVELVHDRVLVELR